MLHFIDIKVFPHLIYYLILSGADKPGKARLGAPFLQFVDELAEPLAVAKQAAQ